MADQLLRMQIEVDAENGTAKLRQFGAQTEQTAKQAGAADSKIKGVTESVGGLSSAVTAFAGMAAVYQTIGFLKSCVTEAAKAELQLVRLTNSLQAAGLGGEDLANGLKKSAYELSKNAMVDDDVAMGMMAVALRMGLTAEQAERCAEAATNLASVLGRGPESVIGINEALARTISSGSGKALRQYGITLDEAKFKAGDADYVLGLFEKHRWAAAAEMDTYTGKIHILSVEFRNLKESIGDFLLTYATNIAAAMRGDIGKTIEPLWDSIGKRLGFVDEAGAKTDWLGTMLDNYNEKTRFTITGQEGLNLALEQAGEKKKKTAKETKSLADEIWGLLRAYNSIPAQASRFVESLRNPPRLATQRYQQVGMLPYRPALSGLEDLRNVTEDEVNMMIRAVEVTSAFQENLWGMADAMYDGVEASTALSYQNQTLGAVTEMMAQGFAQAGAAMLTAAVAGGKANVTFAAVARQLAMSCFAQALYETALGIAALTPWGMKLYGPAPLHFKAAATFAAAGTAAGLLARAGGGGQSGGGGSESRMRASKIPEAATETAQRQVNVTIYLEGHGIVTDPAKFSQEMIEQIKRSMSKSGQRW